MDNSILQNISTLAFVGDAVYTLLIRERAAKHELAFSAVQRQSSSAVSAACQAEAYAKIEPALTELEKDVFRRGRNHRTNNLPKSATAGQYHTATGLECLFGYLYLTGQKDRIRELFEKI